MVKRGVNLSLLWNGYYQECRSRQEIPCMYTQFGKHYREYAQSFIKSRDMNFHDISGLAIGLNKFQEAKRHYIYVIINRS